jgi:hypothetical protein
MKFTKAGHKLSKGLIGSLTMAVNPSATSALIGATSGSTNGAGGTPPPGTPPTSPPS